MGVVRIDAETDSAVVEQSFILKGEPDLPADKSVAHRAALFSALGDGTSRISNYPSSADPQSTLACLRQVGVGIHEEDGELIVEGRGLEGLRASTRALDCGNSGTTMRLLSGVLAGQPFGSVLEGDESLSKRPMERIAGPLRQMGAEIELTSGHAPIRIAGSKSLHGIEYRLPVPSAQVKSCVLLAGLYAEGRTTVIETAPSRDHTERMLGLTAIDLDGERRLMVEGGQRISARNWAVPRDFSAAAFFMVAGSIVRLGEVVLRKVGLNPSRAALLDVLRAMGAQVWISNEGEHGGEPVADVTVRPSQLNGITVDGDLIPVLIDEIPILAVAGAVANGRTEIRQAHELRVKETDRIRAVVDNLRLLGAEVEEFDDGLAIEGGRPLRGTFVESYGDHRIAMAMAVAGLVASGETTIHGAGCAAVSFPGFWSELRSLVSSE